jgi:spore coat protein U-like protein
MGSLALTNASAYFDFMRPPRIHRIFLLFIALSIQFFSIGLCPSARAEACSVSMSNVAFGSFADITGAAVDTAGTMSFACNGMAKNSSYDFCISLEKGSAFSGSTRQLSTGASTLDYGLYSDSGRTTTWGSYETGFGGGGFSVNKPTGSSATLNFTVTVYGRIFANQTTAPPGTYSSTFTGSPFVRWDEHPPAGSPCLVSSKTLQTNFSASATVLAGCTISATNLVFGSVSFINSNIDAVNTVTVSCSNGTPYDIGMSVGNGAGATFAARKMTNGANTITYSLYLNASRTTVWGDTIGTNTVVQTGTGVSQTTTIYGRIPPQTTPPPATYTDTIVATVTF